MPPVKLTWHQGETQAGDLDGRGDSRSGATAALFIGDKGMLLSTTASTCCCRRRISWTSSHRRRRFRIRPATTRNGSHACKGGKPSLADFEYSGWLTEANHLGNVAYRVGKKLHWDADAMKATNAPEADKFIRREYRQGWKELLGK